MPALALFTAACGGAAENTDADTAVVTVAETPSTATASARGVYVSLPTDPPVTESPHYESARRGVEMVEIAAQLWADDTGNARCPTVQDLIDGRRMDPKKATDPWGTTWVVLCHEADFVVLSAGPDTKVNTKDDVSSEEASADRGK